MITVNSIIIFDNKNKLLLLRKNTKTGEIIKWSNNDDKMSVDFIKTDTDFWTLATIIADTHSMKIKYCHNFEGCYGPAYQFIKK